MSTPALGNDYWRIASYGYPSPFGSAHAKEAWAKFAMFATGGAYDALKARLFDAFGLSSNAAESWKSAFESFGLLYVVSGSNRVILTPAGRQLLDAGNAGDEELFGWIGLNVLFRIPVGGWNRTSRGLASNVLGHRLVYGAVLDLDDYLWFEELAVIARVANMTQMLAAMSAIRKLRADPATAQPLPKGDKYNRIRQIAVQSSLNYLVLVNGSMTNPYASRVRPLVLPSAWRDTVLAALSVDTTSGACSSGGSFVPRIPVPPTSIATEQDYFDYVGAPVPLRVTSGSAPLAASIDGESVRILKVGGQVMRNDNVTVTGAVAELCSIAHGDRVILTDDQARTYKIEAKTLLPDGISVQLTVRKAKPIIDYAIILSILDGEIS